MSHEDLPEVTIVEHDDDETTEVIVEGEVEVVDETAFADLPDDPVAAVEILKAMVVEARQEANERFDDLRRLAADFDNFRKRAARDHQTTIDRASERVLSAMLPVLDSFDAALAFETTTSGEEKLLDGMRGTHAQLMSILEREGLKSTPGVGSVFNPEDHEAVMSTATGPGPLIVTAELRRGYRLGGKLLRPGLVTIGDSEETSGNEDE